MVSCTADVRVGGAYRYVLENADGEQVAFSGVYREIIPHERLAYSQTFEPMIDAGYADIIVTFSAVAAGTLVVSREIYPSEDVRDQVIESGMEQGMRSTMDQLDELVLALAADAAI